MNGKHVKKLLAVGAAITSLLLAVVAINTPVLHAEDDVGCTAAERFAELDPTVALEGELADEAQALTARLVGQPEITSVPADRVGDPNFVPVIESSAYPGVPGVRAVVFAADGTPTAIVDPNQPKPDLDVETLVSCVSSGDIDDVQRAITAIQVPDGGFISAGYVPYLDKIYVTTTLDEDIVRAALPKRLTERQLAIVAQSEPAGRSAGSRGSSTSPHYAGARIVSSVGSCSSGFHVTSGAFGPFLMSAGHCASGVNAPITNGTGAFVGTVRAYSFPNPDLLMMNGNPYAGRTYSAPDTTTSAAINGAAGPAFNVSYCNNGATSLETCSNMTSSSTTFCDSGCTTDLAYHERACAWTYIALPGDSGGPINQPLADGRQRAIGILIAGGPYPVSACSTVFRMWYQKWPTMASMWGLSIVNG